MWELHTPAGAAGAVAIFHLVGASPAATDSALARLGLPQLPEGRIARRRLLGIDDGLVVRWSPLCAQLMPHGGPAVTRLLAEALNSAGIVRHTGPEDPMADYPEARTEVEARMLSALARCTSAKGIDLLLDQPRRWGSTPGNEVGVTDPALDRLRSRLLRPPLVAAIGPPNIGKSTLVNALAGRSVAITADERGTTRDHVGVELDLGGLVVHYLDTPGIDSTADPVQTEAQSLALLAARGAALLLLCGDAAGEDPRPLLEGFDGHDSVLVAALRADRACPTWDCDVALRGLHEASGPASGLEHLVALLSESLVPARAINDPRPWRFWH